MKKIELLEEQKERVLRSLSQGKSKAFRKSKLVDELNEKCTSVGQIKMGGLKYSLLKQEKQNNGEIGLSVNHVQNLVQNSYNKNKSRMKKIKEFH